MNAKVIFCIIVLAAGAQSAALPSVLPADSQQQIDSTINISGWIQSIAQQLQKTITTAFLGWTDSLNSVAQNANIALEQLENIANDHHSTFINLNSSTCVKEHIARIAAIGQAGAQDVAQCIQRGINQAVELRETLEEHINAIRAEGQKIANVVRECRDSQPDSVKQCIADSVQVIASSVQVIVAETLELLVAAVAQSTVIVDQTKVCVNGVVERVGQEQADSRSELRDCLINALNP